MAFQNKDSLSLAIVKTLVYASLFNYPLKEKEIWKWLIWERNKASKFQSFKVKEELHEMTEKKIFQKNGYFFLKGGEESLGIRQKREGWSKEKLEIARQTSRKISWLPWIKVVGLTGALAMENADEEDDIDLLIITAKERLWLTRLVLYFLCPILRIKRRRPKDKNVKNKICFNLFLDEGHLKVSPENLFLAHEICQAKPLINKDQTYERFLWENRWVKEFLPNAVSIEKKTIKRDNEITKKKGITISLPRYFAIFDQICFYFQRFYMRPRITIEKVSLHQAFFHPQDLAEKINIKYQQKLSCLGLDKTESWLI